MSKRKYSNDEDDHNAVLGRNGDDNAATHITLAVINQEDNKTYFRVKKDAPMEKLFISYCKKHNKTIGSVEFFSGDGERLNRIRTTASPANLGLKNGDEIWAMERTMGG